MLKAQGETFLHALEHLVDRMDKHFVEVNTEMLQMRTEIQSEISDVRTELSTLRQNHIEHLRRHNSG